MANLIQCKYSLILARSSHSSSLISRSSSDPNIFKRKINELVKWYEQFTGLDEVKMMQNRVLDAQDKFVACQEKRRQSNAELSAIQSKLKDIYSELDTTSRGEERYLHLVTLEHVLLKDEKRLAQQFGANESEERESFSVLSASVKESHEKERAQAERTKYWSVIGSIAGTIIGIVASSISNEFKMAELRSLVKDAGGEVPGLKTTAILARQEQQLSSLMLEMKNMLHSGLSHKLQTDAVHRIDELLHQIANSQASGHLGPDTRNLAASLDQVARSVEEVKGLLEVARRHDGHLIAIPADVESMIRQQKNETRVMIAGVSLFAFLVPIILAYLQRL